MKHDPLRYAHDEGHTDVCYSSDGSKFITCGADGDIRIWSTVEGEDPIHNCIGEWALSVCQKGDFLYVATGSNDIQILTFPQGERNGILDRFVAPINQIAVSKNSEHIALAGEDMEVKLINLAISGTGASIIDGLKGPCLSITLNASYVAASSGDGKLRIWNVVNKQLLKEIECFPKVNSFMNAKLLCRIDFEPSGKYLAYPDKESVVLLHTTTWSQFATLHCDSITSHYSIVQFSPCGKFVVATTLQGDFVVFDVGLEKVKGHSKHPNSIAICGLMWNPLKNGSIVYTDAEGQLGIISDCISSEPMDIPDDLFTENEVSFGDVQFEDDDEDGENVVSVNKLKRQIMGDEESELNFETKSSVAPSPRPRTPVTPLQPPFMPSSTPEHLNTRYLCWNDVGIIRSYGSMTDDDSGKSIEVEFHDSTFHNSMMLQNYQEYVLGSLSKAALVIANAKQIQVIPLRASKKEWLLKLEDSPEDIVLVAASENLICLATSNYLLRVCSIFGTQKGVLSVPGPAVTMACCQHTLLVAYHTGGVRREDQCISIKVIKFIGFSMECQNIDASLGPESTLSWLGFTDCYTPAMMDSRGMLSLHPRNCNVWIPFCDTAKHMRSPADGFFVTAVMESCQTLIGIKCRGSVYPGFVPTPTVSELIMEPPFAEPSTEKSQLEVNLFAWSNLQVHDIGKKFTEAGLKTFALACKNGLDQRAAELMEIVANPQLLNLSTKYAIKMNKKLLAEKLMDLASKIISDDDDELSVATPVSTPASVPNRRLTLNSTKRTSKPKLVPQEISTPDSVVNSSQSSVASTTLPLEESLVEAPKNPFLKKTENPTANPLSLVNKFAGVDYTNVKENKVKNTDTADKRKRLESDTDKPQGKQRKLDRFMFTKTN